MHVLFIFVIFIVGVKCSDIIIDVNQPNDLRLDKFWRSTGFSPGDPKVDFLLSNDVKFNIAFIGAIPNYGIEQIRIHWLLDLIRYDTNTRSYDFTHLDQLLDWMDLHRLRPGFELMGIPINIQTGVITTNVYQYWYELVRETVTRYIGRYGLRKVSEWKFELYNEPDLRSYNIYNYTLNDYLVYVSACRAALDDAVNGSATRLQLGGPAGLFKRTGSNSHPLCWGLLKWCDDMAARCPLQFITFHKKGDGGVGRIVEADIAMVEMLRANYTNVARLPIANE